MSGSKILTAERLPRLDRDHFQLFFRHFLLLWHNSDATSPSNARVYIDAFNRGATLNHATAQDPDQAEITIATPVEVSNNVLGCFVTSSTYHFINLPFCQLTDVSTCNLTIFLFLQLAFSSTYHFTNLSFLPKISPTHCFVNLKFHQALFHQPNVLKIHFVKRQATPN